MYAQGHFEVGDEFDTVLPTGRPPAAPSTFSGGASPRTQRTENSDVKRRGGLDPRRLAPIAVRLFGAYLDAGAAPRLNGALTRRHINDLLEDLLDVLFPGLFHNHDRELSTLETTEEALENIRKKLAKCIDAAIALDAGPLLQPERVKTSEVVLAFLNELPNIRRTLVEDARAANDSDPAARSVCEVVLAYPGFVAIAAHRLAHRLHALGVPLIPRMMSEWAHTQTGIDIHPGATIGHRAFIDHGTGVVIGETAVIGHNVKLYHGVTLGASSTRRKQRVKRHPTIQNNVTLYAHATVLGGTTIVGNHSVVGASVLLAESVPEHCAVTAHRNTVFKERVAAPHEGAGRE